MEIKDMQALIEENKRLQAQIEKLSAEKNLPLDLSALEPTLFDEQLSEDEQDALDAEVKAMEEQNAKTIEDIFSSKGTTLG